MTADDNRATLQTGEANSVMDDYMYGQGRTPRRQ